MALSPDDAKSALPGDTVTYTLQVTNAGNSPDTFDLTATGYTWTTILSDSSVSLGAGEGTSVTVRVNIPSTVAENDSGVVTITASSQGDKSITDHADLTTVAVRPKIYLPTIHK